MLAWINDAGCFNVANVYKIFMQHSLDVEQHYWPYIWKLYVPQRIRLSKWLGCHNKLLTNSVIVKKGHGLRYCKSCLNYEEISFPCCKHATFVWKALFLLALYSNFCVTHLGDWISCNLHLKISLCFGLK